jgi:hypothetical protein
MGAIAIRENKDGAGHRITFQLLTTHRDKAIDPLSHIDGLDRR